MPTLTFGCLAHTQVAVVSSMPTAIMHDSMSISFFPASILYTNLRRQNKGPIDPQKELSRSPQQQPRDWNCLKLHGSM